MFFTERDYRIMINLVSNIYSLSQIASLFFSSNKKAAERMKLLHDARLVERFPQPFTDKKGKSEFIYFLSKKGREVLQTHYNHCISSTINPLRDVYSVPHRLMLADLHAAIVKSSAPQDLEAEYYYPKQIRLTSENLNGVIPDAVAIIIKHSANKALLHFVEADCGTEAVTSQKAYSLEHKIEKYADLFDTKADVEVCREALGYDFKGFRVLFSVTTSRRIEDVKKLSEQSRAEFVWTAEHWKIMEKGVFSPVWSNHRYESLSLTGAYPREV